MSQAQLFYPGASVLGQGALTRTRLANAHMRLYKAGFTPTFSTTLTEIDAQQCDFDGYPAGGIDVGTWSAPIYGPGQSAMITAGLVNFVCTAGPGGVTNLVGGFYLVTADNVLWMVSQFPDGYPMQVAGSGLPVALSIAFGSG